jgi:DNA-binding NarL/FixJ family response regulator
MNTLKAFVVEDSPVVTDSLVAALEELAPIEVVGVVADERAAVQWMKAHAGACDIVIADIFLKDGSGLGVLRAGSEMGEESMDMVVMTNYATPDMRRKCIELGAAQVFDKSSEIDALIAYCASLAADHASRQPRWH